MGRTACTYRSKAHLVPRIISHVEVDCGIQGMDGNFLASKDERHIDLLVARYFPDASNVGSIGVLCTRDAAIHGIGQGPGYLVSIANSVGMRVTFTWGPESKKIRYQIRQSVFGRSLFCRPLSSELLVDHLGRGFRSRLSEFANAASRTRT
jgi:hypothetical protein